MQKLTTNKRLNDQLSNIYNHANLVGAGLKQEDAFNIAFSEAHCVSDYCSADTYSEGFQQYCAQCGHDCILVTP
jgi:hypothetical protein